MYVEGVSRRGEGAGRWLVCADKAVAVVVGCVCVELTRLMRHVVQAVYVRTLVNERDETLTDTGVE